MARLEPCRNMNDVSLIFERRQFQRLLLHAAGFLLIFIAADWLREISLRPNPILQGYLQITTGIFAFVFAAVALVRFQVEIPSGNMSSLGPVAVSPSKTGLSVVPC